MVHSSHDSWIGSVLDLISPGIQINTLRELGCACGKLSVEHLVDLLQVRIGCVPAHLHPSPRKPGEEKASHQEQCPENIATEMRGCSNSTLRAVSFHDFEAIFLDDRVGEHFFRNVLKLFLGFLAGPAFEIQDEEFSLANIFNGRSPSPERACWIVCP